MTFFNTHLNLKLKQNDYERICQVLKMDKFGRFDSPSHFVRCALLRQLRIEEESLKRGIENEDGKKLLERSNLQ